MNIEKFKNILYVKDTDGLVTVTFNTPKKKNSVTARGILEFWWAIDHFEKDETAYALVITGAENHKEGELEKSAFCAGANFSSLPDFEDLSDEDIAPHNPQDIALKNHVIKLNKLDKPVIVAMNGYGIGMGFTLPLSCADFTYMADTAWLQAPFTSIGIVPELASTYLLPRMIGMAKANEILMAGKKVSAQEALELGICTEIFPITEVLEKAKEKARSLMPPRAAYFAVKQTKSLIRAPFIKAMEEALDRENESLPKCMASADFMEGFAARLEKRAPNFSGK